MDQRFRLYRKNNQCIHHKNYTACKKAWDNLV